MELENKIVFITGAASGLGAETARFLHKQGAKIALFDRDLKEENELVLELKGIACSGDVTNESSIQAAIDKVISKWNEIHVLVNCAGILRGGRMVSKNGPMPLKDFTEVIQVNLIGTFNVMRLVATQMDKQACLNSDGERGVIINTASVTAFEGQIGQSAYSASKGGIVSMTLPLARELSHIGIRVNSIAPGVMETPMISHTAEKIQHSLHEQMEFPARFGKPEEFAALVQHIIENNYLNGTTIRLDAAVRMARQ